MRINVLFSPLLCLTLAACGGGGGGGAPASSAAVGVEGFWSGPASTGITVSAVILETGETWGIYSSGSDIYGALYGTSSVTGSTLAISGNDYSFVNNAITQGRLTGSYTAKSSINATAADNTSVALTYDSDYDTPASLSSLAGSYSFTGRSGAYSLVPGNVTIDANGAFTLAQTACAISGTMTPRPNGKSVFNVVLTSAGLNCAASIASLAGVAFVDTSATPRQLRLLALNADRTDGLIVLGTKQ